MEKKNTVGHTAALITILIWGTTFISTKILLNDFTPIEILFYRFVIGFVVLLMIYPHRLKVTNKKHEFIFASAGLCGVTLYYLLENIALTFTMASNVGVISSVVPFFTAILTYLFLKEEPLRINFFIGFLVAITGIYLISFSGTSKFQLNPLGDLLAVIATLVWATYSVLTRKISGYGYHTIQTTRRVFFYGILFMMPTLFLFDFEWELKRFTNPVSLFNILFLGLGASALCFITWNYAVKLLGTIKSSIYIYAVPVITVLTSMIVLDEQITYMSAFGIVLTLSGLFISEKKPSLKKAEKNTSLTKFN
ncbi:DMT family transporter [Lysinibacillus sp. NPDC056232]|uniref:DMT family transporter n=1 Tax=Lysinibacillus sp. NPDC056232 TaxID=3345756 RepID=UPI0035DA2634